MRPEDLYTSIVIRPRAEASPNDCEVLTLHGQGEIVYWLVSVGCDCRAIGFYCYLMYMTKIEGSLILYLKIKEVRDFVGCRNDTAHALINKLSDVYEVIDLMEIPREKATGFKLRVIPAVEFVIPEKFSKDLEETKNYQKIFENKSLVEWNARDFVIAFRDAYRECFGYDYVASWGQDGGIAKSVLINDFQMDGELFKKILDYLFVTCKGKLPHGENIRSFRALANEMFVNSLIQGMREAEEEPEESPSVKRKRKEIAEREANKKKGGG